MFWYKPIVGHFLRFYQDLVTVTDLITRKMEQYRNPGTKV